MLKLDDSKMVTTEEMWEEINQAFTKAMVRDGKVEVQHMDQEQIEFALTVLGFHAVIKDAERSDREAA